MLGQGKNVSSIGPWEEAWPSPRPTTISSASSCGSNSIPWHSCGCGKDRWEGGAGSCASPSACATGQAGSGPRGEDCSGAKALNGSFLVTECRRGGGVGVNCSGEKPQWPVPVFCLFFFLEWFSAQPRPPSHFNRLHWARVAADNVHHPWVSAWFCFTFRSMGYLKKMCIPQKGPREMVDFTHYSEHPKWRTRGGHWTISFCPLHLF